MLRRGLVGLLGIALLVGCSGDDEIGAVAPNVDDNMGNNTSNQNNDTNNSSNSAGHNANAAPGQEDVGGAEDASSADAAAEDASGAQDAAAEPDAPPPPPVDCSALEGQAGWTLCEATESTCGVVFEDGAGCEAVCAAAGLRCGQTFEDLDGQCAPDRSRPALTCSPGSGHRSDYCVCVREACEPRCDGRSCGDDGCGGSCGACPNANDTCGDDGACTCTPHTCAEAGLCAAGHDDGCGRPLDCPDACASGELCLGGRCGGEPAEVRCTAEHCPAFPGAEGEGMFARGGRGGTVCRVTSLDNDGDGTLRRCLTSGSGPLTVVFEVAGRIDLTSPLRVNRSRLTLAGQTAPGDGITVSGYQTDLHGDDLIIQHLRFRAGDARKKTSSRPNGFTEDSLTVQGDDIIIDHVSASWGIDENLSAGAAFRRLTVQYCIIAEGLHRTQLFHGEVDPDHSGHSMGSLFKPSEGNGTLSVHHNLYAHNNNRNPAIGTYNRDQRLDADLRNNVIYNCNNTGYVSGASERVRVNYIGNFLIFGPRSGDQVLFDGNGDSNVQIYQQNNKRDLSRNASISGTDDGWSMFGNTYTRASAPVEMAPVTTHTPEQAVDLVLAQAGARPWSRDSVDQRVVADVRAGTGTIIDSPSQVGGWGTLAAGTRAADSDRDGMPDTWERDNGTDPDAADNNGDVNGDGYTNLENYLHDAARLSR